METPTNERRNLPSASYIFRLSQCPGALNACQGLADISTPEAESGTRIHSRLAGETVELTPEEEDIAESCAKIEESLFEQWKLRHAIPEDAAVQVFRDNKRLWLERDGQKLCSGLADVIYLWDRHALILDFKSGRGENDDASANLQLRCLAVLVQENFGWIKHAETAIIQPLVTHSPTVCSYDVDDLITATNELLRIVLSALMTDAPRKAGAHCKYCRAASTCPETRKEVESLSSLTIHQPGLTVSNGDMAALLARCGPALKMIENIKAECFRRAEADPDSWRALGYEIAQGKGKRAVDDIATVSERLNALGVPWPDITKACSITMRALEPLVRAATGTKGMGLKKECDKVLADCVTTKFAKPSLKKIGTPEEDEE